MTNEALRTIAEFVALGNNASGFLALVFVTGLLLTFVASPIIRWRYRTAIDTEMRRAAPVEENTFEVPAPCYPNHADLKVTHGPLEPEAPLRWGLASRYLLSGLAFTLAHLVVIGYVRGVVAPSWQWALVFLAYFLPVLVFALYVAGLRRLVLFALAATAAGLLIVADTAPAYFVISFIGPSVLVTLVFGNPGLRTTTLPVFSASFVLCMPLVFFPDIAYHLFHSGIFGTVAIGADPAGYERIANVVGFALALAIGIPLALMVFRLIGRITTGSSKFMMQADILFFMTSFIAMAPHWLGYGPRAMLFAIPFVVYRLVLRLVKPRDRETDDLTLHLRVFDQRRGQEQISRGLLTDWRQTGPVMLIGGADLATETLDASELAAYLHRRLDRLFIDDAKRLEAALASGHHRLGDGLYPVQDFYCRSNSWQPTVLTLMSRARRVLIDTRGFRPGRAGIRFEIEALSERVPTAQIIVLADPDMVEVVGAHFEEAWRKSGRPGIDHLTIRTLPARHGLLGPHDRSRADP